MSDLSDEAEDIASKLKPEWARRLAKSHDIKIEMLVHGGNPSRVPPLAASSGQTPSTKRQQIQAALVRLPHVSAALFTEDLVAESTPLGPFEHDLFERTDGTVVLVELDSRFRGSRDEVTKHAEQPRADEKLLVLLPPDLHDDRGFFGTNFRTLIPSTNIYEYTAEQYEEGNLIARVERFSKDLRILKQRRQVGL